MRQTATPFATELFQQIMIQADLFDFKCRPGVRCLIMMAHSVRDNRPSYALAGLSGALRMDERGKQNKPDISAVPEIGIDSYAAFDLQVSA
ncbi:hypothetical protein CaCOL14_011549 [Colletotrichum acutatum]